MPSTREIRRRIRGVRSTAQITKAMEMVAAARMRRAQQRVLSSRPYADRMRLMLADLAQLARGDEGLQFPLLAQRPVRRAGVILITPDRGLCGSLPSNVVRRATRFLLDEAGAPCVLTAVGRKGRDFMRRYGRDIAAEFTGISDAPTMLDIAPMARVAMDDFTGGAVDAVYVIYTRFISTLQQRPEVLKVLPIEPPSEASGVYTDFIFEPSPAEVLGQLLPRFVEVQIYQALLDAIASEQSARMVAMRNATDNANSLIKDLTLT
ncbi:MAG: ATP synthase F1 subunit gamma, partial [Chloroflexi bacterium]|nr:ATP synthase F1 subunit gamma [Chloroflexota bacterium]